MEKTDAEMVKLSFPDRLYLLRDRCRMSKAQLAIKINRSVTHITHLEAGTREPNYATLKAIADVFGVTDDFLLDGYEDSMTQIRGCIEFAAQQGFILKEHEPWLLDVLALYTEGRPPWVRRDKDWTQRGKDKEQVEVGEKSWQPTQS